MTRKSVILHQADAISAKLQLDPLLREREVLRRMGCEFEVVAAASPADKLAAARAAGDDPAVGAVLVQFDWRTPQEEVCETLGAMTAELGRPGRRARGAALAFLDHYDGTSSPHFPALPLVEMYVKKQILRNPEDYAVAPLSGGVPAVALRRYYGLKEPAAPAEPAAEEWLPFVDRIALGWNVGASDFILNLLRSPLNRVRTTLKARRALPAERRALDLHCRVGLADHGFEDWYRKHRRASQAVAEALSPAYRVAYSASGKGAARPISRRRYMRELRRSKVCLSPLGYGEICYRDFEAVAAGCLLVKPSLEHLSTSPNIFEPGQTYVPVRWDLEDAAETIRRYLDDPAELSRIASTARRRLIDSFANHDAAHRYTRLMELATGRMTR